MLNLSDSEKKVLFVWALIGIIILLIVIIFGLKQNRTKEEATENITAAGSNYIIDRNRYYTVKSAITKFYSFVNSKDTDSMLKILNENYVKDNKITDDNIFDYITDSDIMLSYESKKMCLKANNKGVMTFVSEGQEISANTGKYLKDIYYEVTLDGNTSLFNVLPIDKNTFEEVCNG